MEIWGSCTKKQSNDINKIIIQIARYIVPNNSGRTDKWVMNKMKWNSIEDIYKEAIVKFTHKILNETNENKNNLYDIITKKRNIRMKAENKFGPRSKEIGSDVLTRKTYIYIEYMIYIMIFHEQLL